MHFVAMEMEITDARGFAECCIVVYTISHDSESDTFRSQNLDNVNEGLGYCEIQELDVAEMNVVPWRGKYFVEKTVVVD